MNRYTREGIARDLVAGKRVVFVHLAATCVAALHDLCDLPGVTDVRRVRGQERIEHESGGAVIFRHGSRGAFHGLSCDVAYLGHPQARIDPDVITDAHVAVGASGEVILDDLAP